MIYIFQTVCNTYVVELTHDSIQNNIHEASCQDTSFSLNDRCCICMKSFFICNFDSKLINPIHPPTKAWWFC